MSYYWYNRKGILKKAKERYSKEKAAEYYSENKEAKKRKGNGSKQKLAKRRKRQDYRVSRKKWYQQLISTKKRHYKINEFYFCSV